VAADCNECNEALDAAREALAVAGRLATVAGNAILNGDLSTAPGPPCRTCRPATRA